MEHTEVDFQGERPVLNISGNKVGLGPLQKSMAPAFLRWENDFAVSAMSGEALRPLSLEQLEERFERHLRETHTWQITFAIYELASMQVIGSTALRNIDKTHRTAEYRIVIGEKSCWGKGYGTETTILMLDYAFMVLGLHNVVLHTFGYNERAVRAYTRAGFRVIGRQREAARLGDQVHDVIFMDCLATEFRNPLKRVIDLP
ncbi:MAG TPA: GNAT family protein [Ktedonobacteraceae bacterium]|nr:GNAT family protein [Ktedonobacteraceae bacterium]